MNQGFKDLGIDSLTIGISAEGMTQYKADLKVELLETSKNKINDYAELEAALNKGWQGHSLDTFKRQFEAQATKICEDLSKEYTDLENRLIDLESTYFNIDKNIMGEE